MIQAPESTPGILRTLNNKEKQEEIKGGMQPLKSANLLIFYFITFY